MASKRSSVSFSWLTLDADDAPQICISISASRCSTSHCCWASFAFSVKFSDSTVCKRSRSRLISPSSASCEPSRGVAPDDSMCTTRESYAAATRVGWFGAVRRDPWYLLLPVRHGCDWGRARWDAVRLRGRSSELCTLGLSEPGDCGCRLLLTSPRCDRGLAMRLTCEGERDREKTNRDDEPDVGMGGGYEGAIIEPADVTTVVGDIHMSSILVRPFVSTRPGVDWQRPIATLVN
uniref:Uncharacterized protein n=1 Tax=Anopheles atroparvus TaxID=41427 RepID=A0A182JKL2_ANOAO